MNRLFLFLILLLSGTQVYSQLSIAIARIQPLGSTVAIRGVITNGEELGTIRYIQDPTGGIAIYDNLVSYFQRGDSVAVVGVLTDYNGLLEITNITGHTIFTSGNLLPLAQIITPSQLSENYESELIQIENIVFNDGGGFFAGNTSYFFNVDGQTSSIYVRNNHPLIGEAIPISPVTIIGICSQYYSDYQILLRDTNDIINNSNINVISPIQVSNITTTGMDLSWETDVQGTTSIFYGLTPELELGELSEPGMSTSHTLSITGGLPSQLFYLKVASSDGVDTAFSPIKTVITQSISTGDIKVYFTSTVDHLFATVSPAVFVNDAIDDTLINYINRAQYSIDFTMYDYQPGNLANLAGALNDAFDRGVRVRLILDTTWTDISLADFVYVDIRSLHAPTSDSYGIMHNKFVVFDAISSDANDPIVWTGSTNYEAENINTFSNNVVIIQDKSLALTYQIEFEEMWGSSLYAPDIFSSRFGPFKLNNTPQDFIIGGRIVECYFSPTDGTNARILKAIQSADHELMVASMLITRTDLAYAIASKANEGKQVSVLVNEKANCTQTVISVLTSALGEEFYEYQELGIMHHKYMIADPNFSVSDPLVLTGSHNWSNAAENKNDENTLIIYDEEISNWFYQEFMARKNISGPVSINEIKPFEALSIYPNPFRKELYLSFYSSEKTDLIIDFMNLQGQIIQTRIYEISEGLVEIQWSELQLKPGNYLLRVSTPKNQIVKKLIKY